MDHIIDTPAPSESHGNKQNSTFSAPIFIEMGDEDSEYLEAKIKEQVYLHLPFALNTGQLHTSRLARLLKPTKTGLASRALAPSTSPLSAASCIKPMPEADVRLR